MNKVILIFSIIAISFISCNSPSTKESNSETPNNAFETILNRTSIREYTEQQITDNEIEKLLRAGMSAPSSRDRRPWHFIVITDKDMLTSLGKQLRNASILREANRAIVVCGDTLILDNAWFLDCSAATQNILLAATSMGIGAVWTAVYPYADREEIVNNTFQLPDNIRALSIIPLGYPSVEHKAKDKFDETRIHIDKF